MKYKTIILKAIFLEGTGTDETHIYITHVYKILEEKNIVTVTTVA